jgi:hypothetical protein
MVGGRGQSSRAAAAVLAAAAAASHLGLGRPEQRCRLQLLLPQLPHQKMHRNRHAPLAEPAEAQIVVTPITKCRIQTAVPPTMIPFQVGQNDRPRRWAVRNQAAVAASEWRLPSLVILRTTTRSLPLFLPTQNHRRPQPHSPRQSRSHVRAAHLAPAQEVAANHHELTPAPGPVATHPR